jgi:EAL and modified HD-GYP domain-containing signal transduction protein
MSKSTCNKLRFIGRQAILDQKMNVYGHELLFRTGMDNYFSGNAEEATNQVIDNCLSMIACSSSQNLFINCTRESLVNMSVKLLPSRTVVLELLETVTPDTELLSACKRLKQAGYRFAMDDFSPQENKHELIEIADFIKVDFRASNSEARQEIYDMCRHRKTRFIAEKVETLSEVQTAQAEGNSFFQGYFHSRPEIISESQIPTNRASYLQMFGALAKPELDFRMIESLIMQEPSLCYRLLMLANSALYGFQHRVSTIRGALFAVGEDSFRKLVTLVIAGNLFQLGSNLDVRQALERACFCESLASVLVESPAELYMLGMLSMMDRMLNVPMAKLVGLMSLSLEIQGALLGSSNGLGRALQLCVCHEHGGDSVEKPNSDSLVRESASNYFDAVISAGTTIRSLTRLAK